MDKLFAEILWICFAYVIGSIPFGLLIGKAVKNIDIRKFGSGNIGATNVARTIGTKYGIIAFLLDLFKGLIPIIIGRFISESPIFLSIVGLASLLGHLYPLFLNFKGGKGVATTIGLYLAMSPTFTVLSLLPSLFIIKLSGYVSLGSLVFVTIMPFLFLFSFKLSFFGLSLLIFCLIYLRHKENIIRLANGTENPWKKSEFAQK